MAPAKLSSIVAWLAIAPIALSNAGCADMRWARPGTDADRMEEDLAQCRAEARIQASRVSLPRTSGLPSPGLGTDPMGRPLPAPSRSRTEDPMLLEQDLTTSCMRGKGYELAPLERGDK